MMDPIQKRTVLLDIRFQGLWYCKTCGHYISDLQTIDGTDHQAHKLTVIPSQTKKQQRRSKKT